MEGVRTGPKKPDMSVQKTAPCVGKAGPDETFSKHKPSKSQIAPGGEPVHGMPLFSAASKCVED